MRLRAAALQTFKSACPTAGGAQPPVTIFKPLRGDEPELYENLRSFCEQDYHDFRVIFGVADAGDPALAIAQRVRDSLPGRDIVISVGADTSPNPKVANLSRMSAQARGDIFVIADSDMRVDRRYLRAIVASFDDERIGAVTCLYRAVACNGVASTLGAMYVNAYFAPSVLVACKLQAIGFALGATIAVRRSIFEASGGFEALGSHLADDYELGRRTQEAGYEVRLSRYVVENVVVEPTLGALTHHELRWARTISAVQPIGYALSGITFAFAWALLYLLLGGNRRRGFLLAAVALASRIALQRNAYEALGLQRQDPLWLAPARDVLAFAIWAASFIGRKVTWREQTLEPDRRGQLKTPERAPR